MSARQKLPQQQVIDAIRDRDERTFALFLGAGASLTAGVSGAGQLINEWWQRAYDYEKPKKDFEAWREEVRANDPRFKSTSEYSVLFERVCADAPTRQKQIEQKVEASFPSWGYLYLANLIEHKRFNVIFTTNFDDLLNEALTIFLGYNPIVCAADEEVAAINLSSKRAKIIKLHGDYLSPTIKNTEEELRRLTANMERKFKEFATHLGIVVLGYEGNDDSIMCVFEELMQNADAFPHGVYWGVFGGRPAAPRVASLAANYPGRFHVFDFTGFDQFMARLHDLADEKDGKPCPLDLPLAIRNPFQAMALRYQRLLDTALNTIDDPTIRRDAQALRAQLDDQRDLAGAKDTEFGLLQAQLALGRRDYHKALAAITRFVEVHPDHPEALTTWGNALMVKSEEEGSLQAAEEAVAKLKKALALDGLLLGARHTLMRYYALKRRREEGIQVAEELRKLAPKDMGVRRNLVQFYAEAGRFDEAEREVQELLAADPHDPTLHGAHAQVLEQRGMIPEAIDAIRRAVMLAPENAWFRAALANALAMTNRIGEAREALEQAILLDPRSLGFRIQATKFYSALQQPHAALGHLNIALKIAPGSAEVHGWLCQTLTGLRRFDDARMHGDKAVALSPNDSRLRVTLGVAYLHAQQWPEATRHLEAAIASNPTAPEAYGQLAWALFYQNRDQEVSATLHQLAGINPQLAQTVDMQLRQTPRMGQQPQGLFAALQEQVRAAIQPHAPGQTPPPPNFWPGPR